MSAAIADVVAAVESAYWTAGVAEVATMTYQPQSRSCGGKVLL